MFNSVEEVQNTPVEKLVELVKETSDGAGYQDILSEEVYNKYVSANKVVSETQSLAEKIAFAIRDKVDNEFQPEDEDDEDYFYNNDLTNFMQSLAEESDAMYRYYEHMTNPDNFWKPSTY